MNASYCIEVGPAWEADLGPEEICLRMCKITIQAPITCRAQEIVGVCPTLDVAFAVARTGVENMVKQP